jgi:hypothetical protein
MSWERARPCQISGAGTIPYSTITRYLRNRSLAHVSQRPLPEPEIEGADPSEKAALQALDENPFASHCQLAKRTLISDDDYSLSFRHQDGIQIADLPMCPSQTLGSPETHPGHNVTIAGNIL